LIRIYDPTVPSVDPAHEVELPRRPLRGLRLGVIDNSKPNFDVFAHHLADVLTRDHGVVLVEYIRKRSAAAPAMELDYQNIVRKCDLVVAGSGD
jgi:hypothetical protein